MIKEEEDAAENPLTPEQLHQLGLIYRLILSWRKAYLGKAEIPRQPESMESTQQTERINSNESET